MHTVAKFIICALLLVTTCALSWAQLPRFQSHNSGCHSHPAPASNSLPNNHRCCQAGHDFAIPQTGLGHIPLQLFGAFEHRPSVFVSNSSTRRQHTALSCVTSVPL